MSIESTRDITREEAIEKIKYYLSLQNSEPNFESMTNRQLDVILHALKYELDVDRFENYWIVEED